jgi:hypothetical protein
VISFDDLEIANSTVKANADIRKHFSQKKNARFWLE